MLELQESGENDSYSGGEINHVNSEECPSENESFVEYSATKEQHKKKKKCGIVYISTLPPFMNVTKIREIFSLYGELGRVYLQPAETIFGKKKKKKKPAKHFTEGWAEFKSKRIAKQVALQLNNTRIGERKKSKFYDYLWNIKYLPRFKWVHLNERLAYERAVHQQRLRTEISQAKREANFISFNIEKSAKLKKRKMTSDEIPTSTDSMLQRYQQRKTDKEIIEESNRKKLKLRSKTKDILESDDRSTFLKSLFGGNT